LIGKPTQGYFDVEKEKKPYSYSVYSVEVIFNNCFEPQGIDVKKQNTLFRGEPCAYTLSAN
jgi:hypothetical protein